MLYQIVKFLGWIGFRIFFRKIYYSNRNKIPKGKPLIFAVNHPTAFLDPVLAGTFIPPTVHFLVRGDIFENPVIRAILAQLKMYPIFRFRDGFSNLKNNQATMDFCYKKLNQGKHILILAEGLTKHEKRLRPIQKGTARLAFGAIEKYGELDIAVVPVGVNYTDSHRFRSEVMMEVGNPIFIKEMMPVYDENPRKAVKQVTDRIAKELKKLVIHVADPKDDQLVNHFLDIQRNDIEKTVLPTVSSSPKLLKKEFEAVEKINHLDQNRKTDLKNAIQDYQQELDSHQCTDVGVAQPEKYNFINSVFMILGFIPFLIASLLNNFPLWLAKKVADSKVRKIEFHSSVRYGIMLFGYIIFWTILFVIALIIGNKYFIRVSHCCSVF